MTMFRTSDERRVRMKFDVAIPAPFEAIVEITDGRKTIVVRIEDPDHAALCVASCSFPFQEGKAFKNIMQPTDEDIAATIERMVKHCTDYVYVPPPPEPEVIDSPPAAEPEPEAVVTEIDGNEAVLIRAVPAET